MSGTLPTTPVPAAATITSVAPTFISATHSGRVITSSRGAQVWMIDLKYPPLTRAEFAPLWAFLQAQAGQAETFSAVIPEHDAQGTGGTPGTPEVVGAHSIGDKTISTDGWNNSETVLKAGDFVTFSGQTKVYQLTADATTDGAGAVTLNITPGLREALVDNEDVAFDDVVFTVGIRSDITSIDVDHCGHYSGLVIELAERLA